MGPERSGPSSPGLMPPWSSPPSRRGPRRGGTSPRVLHRPALRPDGGTSGYRRAGGSASAHTPPEGGVEGRRLLQGSPPCQPGNPGRVGVTSRAFPRPTPRIIRARRSTSTTLQRPFLSALGGSPFDSSELDRRGGGSVCPAQNRRPHRGELRRSRGPIFRSRWALDRPSPRTRLGRSRTQLRYAHDDGSARHTMPYLGLEIEASEGRRRSLAPRSP